MRTTRGVRASSARSGGAGSTQDHPGEAEPGAVGASTIEGKPVVNAAGKDVGHIEKIMLDVRRGEIAYAVLSFGNAFGLGHKIVEVPWSALVLDTERRCFVLDVADDWSQNDQRFDRDRHPDPGGRGEVGSYYGA